MRIEFVCPLFSCQFCVYLNRYDMAETDKTKREKDKELARIKYVYRGASPAEIAAELDVSRQSVYNWIRAGKWDDLKAEMAMTPEEEIKDLRAQINEVKEEIKNRPEGERKYTPADLDGLRKLYKSLKELKGGASVADMISFGERFFAYVRKIDPAFAKSFYDYYDLFIVDNM